MGDAHPLFARFLAVAEPRNPRLLAQEATDLSRKGAFPVVVCSHIQHMESIASSNLRKSWRIRGWSAPIRKPAQAGEPKTLACWRAPPRNTNSLFLPPGGCMETCGRLFRWSCRGSGALPEPRSEVHRDADVHPPQTAALPHGSSARNIASHLSRASRSAIPSRLVRSYIKGVTVMYPCISQSTSLPGSVPRKSSPCPAAQ